MKASMVILAAAGLVAAQSIPQCVYTCLPDAIGNTCSSSTDITCICKNLDSIMSNGASCFAKECSEDDLKNATTMVSSLCGTSVSSGSASASASKSSSSGSASASKTADSSKTTSPASGSGVTSPTPNATNSDGDSSSTDASATGASATNASGSNTASSSPSASASDTGGDAARPVIGAGLAMFAAFLAL